MVPFYIGDLGHELRQIFPMSLIILLRNFKKIFEKKKRLVNNIDLSSIDCHLLANSPEEVINVQSFSYHFWVHFAVLLPNCARPIGSIPLRRRPFCKSVSESRSVALQEPSFLRILVYFL